MIAAATPATISVARRLSTEALIVTGAMISSANGFSSPPVR